MERILIANIFGIGDVLFTTPLITNLKMAFPRVTIDYMCNARTKDILEDNIDIDDIHVYEKDDFVKLWRKSKVQGVKGLYKLLARVREKQYDAVFDFTLSREFGLFFMLTGIPRRIGLDYKKRGIFLTDKISFVGFEGRHVVEHYLDLLKCINVPVRDNATHMEISRKSSEWAPRFFETKGLGEKPVVALIPGGGASWGKQASRKRWQADKFCQVADDLTGCGMDIIILGDGSEEKLCRDIADKMKIPPVVVGNDFSLKKYVELLSKCDLVLCNDGGPLHVAVALGVKTVSIFGPVDDKVYGPYPTSDRHIAITNPDAECQPCYSRFKVPECEHDNKCLVGIKQEAVTMACLKLVNSET